MPKLLRERIVQYDIPPAPGAINFEDVLIFQVPDQEWSSEKWSSDSTLYKPEYVQDADKRKCPRGIIVSAGLKALDIMRDHGMQLGEMVLFSPNSFHRFQVKRTGDGKMVEFPFMHISDVHISEDIPSRLAAGELEMVRVGRSYRFVWAGEEATEGRIDPPRFSDNP